MHYCAGTYFLNAVDFSLIFRLVGLIMNLSTLLCFVLQTESMKISSRTFQDVVAFILCFKYNKLGVHFFENVQVLI